jgi:membrane fusion protein, copper/silver efflux system
MPMTRRPGISGPGLGTGRLNTRVLRAAVVLLAAVVVACAPAPQTSNTPAAGTEMPRSIVDPYLKIQSALADDSTDGVKQNAGAIATAAAALGAPAMKIDTAAVQLAAAADLAAARDRFGALSEAIDAYMTGLKLKAPDGVRVAVCPMVQKPWLQEGSTIANPYYGKEMPTCGNFR